MAVEIERKFLVRSDGWRDEVTSSTSFKQGYLSSSSKATVRVRTKDDAKAVLTLKAAVSGRSRAEYEYEIPIDEARELLELSRPFVIEKTRHIVPSGELAWEIDVFEGKHQGLVMAEIELDHPDQDFDRPDWLGEEVTEDDRYYNASLSRAERPPQN